MWTEKGRRKAIEHNRKTLKNINVWIQIVVVINRHLSKPRKESSVYQSFKVSWCHVVSQPLTFDSSALWQHLDSLTPFSNHATWTELLTLLQGVSSPHGRRVDLSFVCLFMFEHFCPSVCMSTEDTVAAYPICTWMPELHKSSTHEEAFTQCSPYVFTTWIQAVCWGKWDKWCQEEDKHRHCNTLCCGDNEQLQ